MKKSFALFAIVLLALSLGSSGGALANEANREFEFHVGDAFNQGFGFPADDVARSTASGPTKGDTISVIATGELRVNGKKAEGSGSFAHRNAAGATVAVGSFTAERLVSFTDFGSQSGLPSTLHGGTASILVHVVAHPAPRFTSTVKFDGVLTIDCELGNFPAGFQEGITFVVKNGPFQGLVFDQKVSGVNVFVANDEEDSEKD